MEPLSTVGAMALMPYDSFAQRRADDQSIIQQQAVVTALSQQQADARRQAARELQQTFNAANKLDVLQPDRKRIQDKYINPWRKRIADTLEKDYHGNVAKFQAEQGEWMLGQMLDEVSNSPELEAGTQHKQNYALMLKAQQDGKVLRGDPTATMADFFAGKRADLPFLGAYDRPKTSPLDYLKTPHPDSPYGFLDPKTGVRRPRAVSLQEQIAGTGLSAEDAQDWLVTKQNYNPALTWGMEDPLKLDKANMDRQKFAWDKQNDQFDNGIASARLGIAQSQLGLDREKLKLKKEGPKVTTGESYVPIVYGPTGQPGGAINGLDTYYHDIADPKAQTVILGLAGAKAVTSTTKNINPDTKVRGKDSVNPVTYNGQPVYDVNATKLPLASDPTKAINVQGGKARVFNIDPSRVIKLPIKSERGQVNGYSSWLKAQFHDNQGRVGDVLIPVNASDAAQRELNGQIIIAPKKENQKVQDAEDNDSSAAASSADDPFATRVKL